MGEWTGRGKRSRDRGEELGEVKRRRRVTRRIRDGGVDRKR